MNNPSKEAGDDLKRIIGEAYGRAVADGSLPGGALPPEVEPARDQAHGDWASGFALRNAKPLGKPPRFVAETVVAHAEVDGSFFRALEVAGAGFINGWLAPGWFAAVPRAVVSLGEAYGRSDYGGGLKVMVEFVSANPTGPMTTGNARGGVLGDSLASVLAAAGYDVYREFYLNDAGHQVELFGKSLEARYLQELGVGASFPDDGYHGDYITDLARKFISIEGDALLALGGEERRRALCGFALPLNIEKMKEDLNRYRITYDCWFAESSLHAAGEVDRTIDLLGQKGATFERDGALWFRATEYGGDKDEVLVKSNGFHTYFAVDIAYHRDKFIRRGFDTVIDIWGADHHGHVRRMEAAMSALGISPLRLKVVLMQLVRFMRDGEVVRMSKRTGRAIELSSLLDEITVDAARFFFNQRQADSHLEFDLDLAVRQDPDNPVYYVQYAHARIASLVETLAREGYPVPEADAAHLSLLRQPAERELIKVLSVYPQEIYLAARDYDPSRVNRYAIELAGAFHRFYNAHRIMGADRPTAEARLLLSAAVRQVLKNALGLLGVEAPDEM